MLIPVDSIALAEMIDRKRGYKVKQPYKEFMEKYHWSPIKTPRALSSLKPAKWQGHGYTRPNPILSIPSYTDDYGDYSRSVQLMNLFANIPVDPSLTYSSRNKRSRPNQSYFHGLF